MTSLILTATMFLAVSADVEIHTVDGAHVVGQLAGLDAKQVVVETKEGKRTLSASQLLTLSPVKKTKQAKPLPVKIRLIDGTTVAAVQFTVAGGKASIDMSGRTCQCSCDAVRSVRLVAGDDAAGNEWNRLIGLPFDSDVLVVVSRSGALNYHRGVIKDVTDETVAFELDSDVLHVKRKKIFGVIYYHPSGRSLPGSVATLVDTNGSRWEVNAISLKDNGIRLTTPSGVVVDCPFDRLSKIDYSEGKSLYLGQLKPRSVRWTPYFGLDDEPASRKAFYSPINDPKDDKTPPMRVGGKDYKHGIALCSRTEVVYDLPEGYRRLKAIAGIDDAYRPRGNAQLVIRADKRVLLDDSITGQQTPRQLDLDISGAKRLTILVDFGQDMDLADHVDLCEARLVK